MRVELVPGEGRDALPIDIYPAEGAPLGMAVLLLHGGGWMSGSRSEMRRYAEPLTRCGITAVAVDYRLIPGARLPDQVEDIRDCVRWVRQNADALQIDPDRIVLQGFSAGGHLALLVAGTLPGSGHEQAFGGRSEGADVAAVVAFFAPSILTADVEKVRPPPLDLLLGGGDDNVARWASPITYVNPKSPTTFIVCGVDDIGVSVDVNLRLFAALRGAGVAAELHLWHSQIHEFSSMPGITSAVMDEVAFFLRRTLIDRDALIEETAALNPFARMRRPETVS